jgi:hypothetical protein
MPAAVMELALPSNGCGVVDGLVAGLVAEDWAVLTVARVVVPEALGVEAGGAEAGGADGCSGLGAGTDGCSGFGAGNEGLGTTGTVS